MRQHRKRRLAIAALLAFVVGTASFAFAASNTVGDSKAGIGTGVVSGYTIESVSWDLNDTNPANVDDVTFSLAGGATATEVKARALGTGSTPIGSGTGWVSCAGSGSGPFTCAFSGVTTAAVTGLEVASAA